MAWTLFGKRQAPGQLRRTPAEMDTVGYHPNDLATRFDAAQKSGGGIQPNAHPEFDTETPFDKLTKTLGNIVGSFTKKK